MKNSTNNISKATYAALSSLAAMYTLMIAIHTQTAFASILSTYDFILASGLMVLSALSIIFRIDNLNSKWRPLLTIPMIILDGLLLAKFSHILFIDHLVTMQLIASFTLSIVPLVVMLPPLISDIFPKISENLPILIAGLIIAPIILSAGFMAAAIWYTLVACSYIYHYTMGVTLTAIDTVTYVAATTSHELGLRETASTTEEYFKTSKQWFNHEHCAQTWVNKSIL